MKKKYPLEDAEQYLYTQWLDLKKIPYFAVPNVTQLVMYIKSKIGKIKFWEKRKKEGVKKGVPDLVVFLPNKILFVEMKRVKGSRVSNEQNEWIDLLNKYDYCVASVCYGGEDAITHTKTIRDHY